MARRSACLSLHSRLERIGAAITVAGPGITTKLIGRIMRHRRMVLRPDMVGRLRGTVVLRPDTVVRLRGTVVLRPDMVVRLRGTVVLRPDTVVRLRGTVVLRPDMVVRHPNMVAETRLMVGTTSITTNRARFIRAQLQRDRGGRFAAPVAFTADFDR